jgi:hypothetical protein
MCTLVTKPHRLVAQYGSAESDPVVWHQLEVAHVGHDGVRHLKGLAHGTSGVA